MMRMMGRRAVILIFLATLGCNAELAGPEEEEFGVLFIGNSLTAYNELPDLLEDLLVLADIDAHVESVTLSNAGLQDHWFEGSSRDAIALGGWDVVVMQQGPSATEGRPSLLEYSQIFAQDVRGVGARPALYMVWPAATRAFDFAGVSESYRMAAELVDGLLFPVGEAWLAAWRLDQATRLYGPDGFHPTEAGTYLAALVMFQQLAGVDPRSLPLDAGGTSLSEEVVTLLQEAAAQANAEFARP